MISTGIGRRLPPGPILEEADGEVEPHRSAETDLVPVCQAAGTIRVLGGVFNSGILETGPLPGASYD